MKNRKQALLGMMTWWPLIRQFPKFALVFGLIVGSTLLFGIWWFFFYSGKGSGTSHAEDIRPKLALIESKPGRLLVVDNDLYDLDDGHLIFRNWLQGDLPIVLFFDPASKKLIAQYERGFIRYGLDGREEARLTYVTKPAFGADLEWVVLAREKNVWRADVDWRSFKFANERKVTSIDQFNESNFADNILLATPKTLVVRNFNTLLRIDLESGSVKPTRNPLGSTGSRSSPDSKWVAGTLSGQFYCYDVDADTTKTIPVGRTSVNAIEWQGNEKCLGLAAGKAVVSYDRLTHTLTEIAALPFPCFKMGEPSPDGRFIFCAGGIDGRNGALIDVAQKTASRLTGGAGITWISNDTFAFSREVPDSELRGVWLQKPGGEERRISPEPYLVSNGGGQLFVLPAAGLVVFETRHGLSKIKPDGSELTEFIKLSSPASRVMAIKEWGIK